MNQWNGKLYDEKLDYVSRYGRGVVDLLAPKHHEYVVDLGCGTGDLTKEISHSGAKVLGIDASKDMLDEARTKYPELNFIQANANTFQLDEPCHSVFSNAALHWMRNPEQVIASVYQALRPDGRFVAEFGGKDNVNVMIKGILDVLTDKYELDRQEVKQRVPWYFPSVGEYSQLLEAAGFRVAYARHYDRPTVLADGDKGMNHWLESFTDDFFPELTKRERLEIYELVKERLRLELFENGSWIVDYKRLQMMAVK